MLFNSIPFLFFFAIVFIVYWLIPGKARAVFLSFASVVFYAVWGLSEEGLMGIRWTVHFLTVVLVNYTFVKLLFRAKSIESKEISAKYSKILLWIIVLINLGNLAFFKYFYFAIRIFEDVGLLSVPDRGTDGIFLPLAISFYTFQVTAYVVDVYRDVIDRQVSFGRFFLFIIFFPQLIAGPIMRSTDFLPQVPTVTARRIYDGGWLLIGGLIKKVLLADPMGTIVTGVYSQPQAYDGLAIMIGGMCFSLQVYCDFSGYTDMARGCAKLLGYEIPENFRAPFFSQSAREMWQRWHITLATWLRDYIYFPLGGNKVSALRTYINQVITFTLGGLWHGADYTYVLWGAMWGFLIAVERFIEKQLGFDLTAKNKFTAFLKIVVMFILFSFGALMFRSHATEYDGRKYSSSEIMGEMIGGLVTHTPYAAESDFEEAGGDSELIEAAFGREVFRLKTMDQSDTVLFMFLALLFFHWVQYKPEWFERFRKYDLWLLIAAAAVTGGYLLPAFAQSGHQFIYFVF